MGIRSYSNEDLKKELMRREQIKDKPAPLPEEEMLKGLSKLIKNTESVIDDYAKYGRSKDDVQYMYEALMKFVYGNDVFYWINEVDA